MTSAPRIAAAENDNWDSYGGLRTTDVAVRVAEMISEAWHSTSEGGLAIELEADDRELRVEVGSDGKIKHASLTVK